MAYLFFSLFLSTKKTQIFIIRVIIMIRYKKICAYLSKYITWICIRINCLSLSLSLSRSIYLPIIIFKRKLEILCNMQLLNMKCKKQLTWNMTYHRFSSSPLVLRFVRGRCRKKNRREQRFWNKWKMGTGNPEKPALPQTYKPKWNITCIPQDLPSSLTRLLYIYIHNTAYLNIYNDYIYKKLYNLCVYVCTCVCVCLCVTGLIFNFDSQDNSLLRATRVLLVFLSLSISLKVSFCATTTYLIPTQ